MFSEDFILYKVLKKEYSPFTKDYHLTSSIFFEIKYTDRNVYEIISYNFDKKKNEICFYIKQKTGVYQKLYKTNLGFLLLYYNVKNINNDTRLIIKDFSASSWYYTLKKELRGIKIKEILK
jgi:hypothetical protein